MEGKIVTYPLQLLRVLLLWHLLAESIRVPESPHRQLVEDGEFREDIEVKEPKGSLLVAKRVGDVRCLRIVLASGVLVKVLGPVLRCQLNCPCATTRIVSLNVRQSSMRRDPLQQAQSNLEQLV
jgi:hypothetical protein